MFYVYVLLCSDNTLYTGYAKDLKDRIEKHNRGEGSKYVRSRLPAKLVYSEEFQTKSEAMKREAEIKGWKRDKKIEMLNVNVK